ncbi:hypothetical protein [Pseudoalteromonas sp. H103]|uniref:hypothetical protein n=1 Tax=Pseudoalteromonas sp. H103 TaxID=1761893 RepID=UPI00073222E0|nr:hypothetical protein [Pseudoalteromonas sp. H103]KTF12837.1 hypothetical protein ATS74_05200 [Pseudoalteromonas sp. H103]
MEPEQAASLTINIITLIVSIGFIIQGRKLKNTLNGTIAVPKEVLQKRGSILLICGILMFILQSYELIEVLM